MSKLFSRDVSSEEEEGSDSSAVTLSSSGFAAGRVEVEEEAGVEAAVCCLSFSRTYRRDEAAVRRPVPTLKVVAVNWLDGCKSERMTC